MLKPTSNGNGKHKAAALNRHLATPFPFVAFPQQALNALAAGKIKPVDVSVLLVILKFRKNGQMTAWVKNETIARLANMSENHAGRSLQRLTQADLIRRQSCGRPDPLDPENMTGYSFTLLFQGYMHALGSPPAGSPPAGSPRAGTNSDGRKNSDGSSKSDGRSSSSSTPPPANSTTTTFASLPKNKSGGSKQEARPLSDAKGRRMIDQVASQCPHLPGAAAKFKIATDLGLRCAQDWRLLAAAVVRLDAKVAAGDCKPRNPAHVALGMLPEMRSPDYPTAELDALYAKVDEILKPKAQVLLEWLRTEHGATLTEEGYESIDPARWPDGLPAGFKDRLTVSKRREIIEHSREMLAFIEENGRAQPAVSGTS